MKRHYNLKKLSASKQRKIENKLFKKHINFPAMFESGINDTRLMSME